MGVFLVLLTLWAPVQRPTLTVYPRVFLSGESVRVTCRIVPSMRNRLVQFGVYWVSDSARELDLLSPRTFVQVFDRVTCNTGPAFCTVVDNEGHSVTVTENLSLAGCQS